MMVSFSLATASCSTLNRQSPSPQGANQTSVSNGEQIYFTGADSQGNRISYTGGPNFGGMMMALHHAQIPLKAKEAIASGNLEHILQEEEL